MRYTALASLRVSLWTTMGSKVPLVPIDQEVIRKAPLFTALDDAAAASLLANMVSVKIAKGSVLFAEGDEGDQLYVIAEGKLKLGTSSGDGRENLLSILGPGEMFGELSLFDPGPRTSTATAVTDAKLLSLGQEKLLPWLIENPMVSLQLLASLAQRLRRTNEAVGDLVFSDVPGRVAKALIDLGERFGKKTDEGLFVHHDLTQEELAQLVGASRETVNKALADFVGRNWLKLDGRAVLITDFERLSKRGK
jgi:CRP/FNR family cyclic AMP-dependent transcriptional regulator